MGRKIALVIENVDNEACERVNVDGRVMQRMESNTQTRTQTHIHRTENSKINKTKMTTNSRRSERTALISYQLDRFSYDKFRIVAGRIWAAARPKFIASTCGAVFFALADDSNRGPIRFIERVANGNFQRMPNYDSKRVQMD